MALFRTFGLWGLWRDTKPANFPKKISSTIRTILMETEMKELSFVFSEKSELRFRGISVKIAFPHYGVTERHVPCRNSFEVICPFLAPAKLGYRKMVYPKTERIVHLFTILGEFFDRVINFQLFSAFWKIKKVSYFLKKVWEMPVCFSEVGKKDKFWEKYSPLIKNTWHFSKKPCSLVLKFRNVLTSFQE